MLHYATYFSRQIPCHFMRIYTRSWRIQTWLIRMISCLYIIVRDTFRHGSFVWYHVGIYSFVTHSDMTHSYDVSSLYTRSWRTQTWLICMISCLYILVRDTLRHDSSIWFYIYINSDIVYVHMYMYTHIYLYTLMNIHTNGTRRSSIWIYIHACMYLCIYKYIHIYKWIYTYIYV